MRFDNDDDDDGGGVIQETIDRIHYNLLRALSAVSARTSPLRTSHPAAVDPGASNLGGSTSGLHLYLTKSSSVAPLARKYSSSMSVCPVVCGSQHKCTTQSAKMSAFLQLSRSPS